MYTSPLVNLINNEFKILPMFTAFAPALVDYIHLIDNYPQKGGHALVKKTYKMPGGAGCNVAHNIAKLNVKSTIFTTLGRDSDAEFFVKNTAAKVVAEYTHELTGRVDIYVDSSGERTFFVHPNAAGKPYVKVKPDEYLYLDPFPSDKSFEVQLNAAKNSESFVILNPGFPYVSLGFKKLSELLKYVDMLILSEFEFKYLGASVKDILKLVDYLIITQGDKGSRCYTKTKSYKAEAFKVKPVDTTGAGDAFAAGFIYCFMNEMPLDICLRIGNFCGAYNVKRVGARNFPSLDEIESILSKL